MVEVNPERKNGQKKLDELNKRILELEKELEKLHKERGKLKAKLMLLGQYER